RRSANGARLCPKDQPQRAGSRSVSFRRAAPWEHAATGLSGTVALRGHSCSNGRCPLPSLFLASTRMNLTRPRFAFPLCGREFKCALGWALTTLLCPAAFAAPARVVIITPHIDSIRHEFGRAFAVWHREHFGESAEVEWRQVGGTSDALRFVQSEFA